MHEPITFVKIWNRIILFENLQVRYRRGNENWENQRVRIFKSQVWIELKDKVNIEKEVEKMLNDETYLKKKNCN